LGISGGNAVIWQTRHTQFPLRAHGTLAKAFLGGGARNWVAVEILKINDNLAAAVKLVRPVFVFRDLLNQLLMLLKGAHHRIWPLQREVGQRRQSCQRDAAFHGHRSFGCEEPQQTLFRIIDDVLGLELEIQSPTPLGQ
jgi:hypothetical protein